MYYAKRVRVIAGTYRSRPLVAPPGTATRPTSDRLRETLFNVLALRIAGTRFADLYAGTGAVGIEAISRGAEHVFFAETNAKALTAIRANLKSLEIRAGYTLEPAGTATLLKRIVKQGNVLDVVFLDPPYDEAEEYTRTLSTLGSEGFAASLAEDVLVLAEHTRKQPLSDRYGRLARTRTLLQGDAALSFYSIAEPVVELPALVD